MALAFYTTTDTPGHTDHYRKCSICFLVKGVFEIEVIFIRW